MKAPWDFSREPDPATAKINLPTPDGEALGRQLARWYDQAEPAQLAAFPGMLPRCNECAFKAGTLPNGCPETVMDALKCVLEDVPFYCHKGLKEGEAPTRLCTGFMVLMSSKPRDPAGG